MHMRGPRTEGKVGCRQAGMHSSKVVLLKQIRCQTYCWSVLYYICVCTKQLASSTTGKISQFSSRDAAVFMSFVVVVVVANVV